MVHCKVLIVLCSSEEQNVPQLLKYLIEYRKLFSHLFLICVKQKTKQKTKRQNKLFAERETHVRNIVLSQDHSVCYFWVSAA